MVDGFADKVGRELIFEFFGALMRVAPLRERHRAAVVPAVDHFGHTCHPSTRFERRIVDDVVDVRFVDFEIVRKIGIGCFGLFPNFHPGDAGLFHQFIVFADGLGLASFVANPDR